MRNLLSGIHMQVLHAHTGNQLEWLMKELLSHVIATIRGMSDAQRMLFVGHPRTASVCVRENDDDDCFMKMLKFIE